MWTNSELSLFNVIRLARSVTRQRSLTFRFFAGGANEVAIALETCEEIRLTGLQHWVKCSL